jgi:thioredoxin reductase
MESWKHKMPPGMLLKSHAWSSSLCQPQGELTLEEFCRREGREYDPTMLTPVEVFSSYGDAFQKSFAPEVAEKNAINIAAAPDGFRIVFDDGEAVAAKRVVLAIGVHPFSYMPEVLAALPPGAVSHSAEYGAFDRLAGREVVVVGAGASATGLAALLHERGVSTSLVARASRLNFANPPAPLSRPLLRRLVRPGSGIGSGWLLWICANAPWLFHQAPGPLRRHIVRNTLGPLGGSPMKERLIGKMPVRLGWDITGADFANGRVVLRLRNRHGEEQLISADHVVAATGFRIDVERLAFLDPSLRRKIRTVGGAPVLSQDYETSARGLHVIGPASADSFGPVARFVFGAIHPARRLARRFSADAARRPRVLASEPSLVAAERA